MNLFKTPLLIIVALCMLACGSKAKKQTKSAKVNVVFQEGSSSFTDNEKAFISNVIETSENEIRKLLPKLPTHIEVVVETVNRDLGKVGGVTGRTETNSPPVVIFEVSNNYKGGIVDSLKTALRSTTFHEFHHLSRGWAIQDNKFSYGIPNAMVNEGLAIVFSEIYSGNIEEINSYPKEADSWVKEIIALPQRSSYSDWVMGEHPDGRTYIAYRAGNFLIRKAMAKSGKSILELSDLPPEEIIKLSGY